MTETFETRGDRQRQLLRLLLHNKRGLGVDTIGRDLGITRNAVRQHLAVLERDGLVTKGAAIPSGGRPEQLYVLAPRGGEQFPRQYSWFAELLLQELAGDPGNKTMATRLAELGRKVAASVARKLAGRTATPERIASLAAVMNELGYDATPAGDGLQIDAYNCVYHSLPATNPDVCAFDLALLSSCSGAEVEHQACMVRGGDRCRFRFVPGSGRKPD